MCKHPRFRSVSPHGAAVRAVRSYLGIPRRTVAAAAGISDECLRQIELGVVQLDPDELRHIWEALIKQGPLAEWKKDGAEKGRQL